MFLQEIRDYDDNLFTSILLFIFATDDNFVALQFHIDLIRLIAGHVHCVGEISLVVNLQLGWVAAQLKI
jgi:hypothetical protein